MPSVIRHRPSCPSPSYPTTVPHPTTSPKISHPVPTLQQRVRMVFPPRTLQVEANTQDATQHRFSKVGNRVAPSVCATLQSRPNNRANTSTNRQNSNAISTSVNSSSLHAVPATSHLRPAGSTRHRPFATGHRAPVHQIPPQCPSHQHPPPWPNPVPTLQQRVRMGSPLQSQNEEANTQHAAQHRFSKVSNRAAPAGVCTPAVASNQPSQHKHQTITSKTNAHIGEQQQSPCGSCYIPLTACDYHTPSAIRHRPTRPSPSNPTAVPIPPTSTTVATPGSEVTTTCPNGVPAPDTE